jgi:hypothetical protein
MASIQTRKMNWIRDPTPWQQNLQWRAKRAVALEKFEAQAANFVNGLSTAQSNQSSGLANLTFQIASDRITAASNAKRAELRKSLNQMA